MREEAGAQVFFKKVWLKVSVATNESAERLAELKEKTDARCLIMTMMKAAGIELETEWVKG
ncbi:MULTISPECIES: hypothetical protein [Bacillaceae]|uniref:OsmC family protein n=1 Tax=Domibacillus aminovorans TaxID=29332 RepID=A0A177L301_9BACI|nr:MULTISPECIES: hypothetical protein [Bacillaceae]OAH59675.1 hypothetical protein AWH48_00790 [Domibacillus aminovorans]